MTTLLLVTAGATDLQILFIDKDVECRTKPGELRAFHESLLQATDWIIDEAAVRCQEYQERQEIAPPFQDYLCDSQERIRLIPAKLKPILDKVGTVDAAVVFASWRDPECKDAKNEPVAVGPVLAGWIEARNKGNLMASRDFALQRREPWDPEQSQWPGGAQWVNLLRGMEQLEGDNPVRSISQELVARLHNTLTRLQENLKPDQVIIARTGGFPEVKQLIVFMASLIFGSERVKVMEVPERAGHVVTFGANELKSAQEAYQLREAALSRVRKGDLEGAAAFAVRSSGDELERHWAEPVMAAADWLAGRRSILTNAPIYLQRLKEVGLRCFLAAARAEAALRGGRFHEAIIASVTFRDAALLDAIQRLGWVKDIDELQGTLTSRQGMNPPPSLTEGEKPNLKPAGEGRWFYYTNELHVDRWITEMGADMRDAFGMMRSVLSSGSPKIVNYRHMAVHGRLVGNDLKRAVREFKKAGVWSEGETLHFLHPGEPANNVLTALGVPNARVLVETVFKELEAEILRR